MKQYENPDWQIFVDDVAFELRDSHCHRKVPHKGYRSNLDWQAEKTSTSLLRRPSSLSEVRRFLSFLGRPGGAWEAS
jgi:hypothetical protein